jgi:hypothetical protein
VKLVDKADEMPHPLRMRFSRLALAATTVAVVSCGPPSPTLGPRPVLVDDRVYSADAPPATTAMFDVPATRVWLALEAAYKSLEIEVTTQDIPSHTIGNRDFWKMRTLGSTRLSRFVDCGSGPSGNKADSYRIYLSVLSVVTTQPNGRTKVETQVVPTGVDVYGGAVDRLPCGSTGELERQIAEGARKFLGP